jgi:hypothetical protein
MRTRAMGAVMVAVVGGAISCGSPPSQAAVVPKEDPRAFEEFIQALDNTLVEVNELERMGGGLRDRMILVDAESLAKDEDQYRLTNAIRLNYGKIRSLRSSLESNEGVREVVTRNGHSIGDLVAIDAKSEGVVILYYEK